ncbi:MAG: aminotransferase class V-fold PLP-dependent enzyme [Verrucomicrobia bacterium]|nr:aminotransferase class V-fold PLP-dependent enzyme [Verrucomicrobiota bacterium]
MSVEEPSLCQPASDPAIWPLDPDVVFLNHGSFGSCPRPVLEFQQQIRARLEQQPVQFFVRDLEGLLDSARAALAEFVGADADDLVFVPNATAGVNTVLRSLRFERGDELMVTDHEYNACRNALDFAAAQWGARVTVVAVPFPLASSDDIVASVMERVTPRTRLALLDHVTSQTGLVMPIQRLAEKLAERGVETLVDGAHAPGMMPLRLREIGAAYYTGNCHKWLCAPKGAGFLVVRRDRQALIRPLAISHGANSTRTERSRFQIEFGWTGTCDPSAWLSVPESLRWVGSFLPGGWPEVMRRNRALALAGRKILCDALGIALPCPEKLIGSLASIPIADAADDGTPASPLYADPLQDRLRLRHRIEVPIIPWPAPPKRLLRISAQLYNSLPQYRLLAGALKSEMEEVAR